MTKQEIIRIIERWAGESDFDPMDYQDFVWWRAGQIARDNVASELIAAIEKHNEKGAA